MKRQSQQDKERTVPPSYFLHTIFMVQEWGWQGCQVCQASLESYTKEYKTAQIESQILRKRVDRANFQVQRDLYKVNSGKDTARAQVKSITG